MSRRDLLPLNGWGRISCSLPAFLLFFAFSLGPAVLFSQEREVLGWRERALVMPEAFDVVVVLDSGARYSYVRTAKVEEFVRRKTPWVRFTLQNRAGKEHVFERAVEREVALRIVGGEIQRVPVVSLRACVGFICRDEEFRVTVRPKFRYQLKLGRDFLADRAVIDPSASFTVNPDRGGQ